MQFGKLGKLVAAGTIAAMFAGSTVAFAQLQNYPAPFVQNGVANTLVVVGATAQPIDVVGAIDLAVRLGGENTQNVVVPGLTGMSSVSGAGKTVDTTTTHVFLNDNLGKTGLRTTFTKDDLPTLLAQGSFSDTDGTHKYTQFIDLTPGTVNPTNVKLQFDKPGSSSSTDPAYNFGRFTTSPTTTEFMYKARVVFDVAVNGTSAASKSLNIFGNSYTISADTSTLFSGSSSEKLVLFGGANEQILHGGESLTTTLGGQSYKIQVLGVTSSNAVAVQVGSTTETIALHQTSSNFGDLKIYVKDAAQLSSTDQTQNYADLLIGADKLTLQNNAKVKRGTNDDSVDGTLISLSNSGGKLSQVIIYFGGSSSTNDFIAAGSPTYANPVFGTFGIAFPSVSPSVGGASDDHLVLKNSGDNNLQATLTDNNGNTATVNYATKATSGGTQLSLADSSGNAIHVGENETVSRDEYIILDAGGYPHMFKVSSVSLDGSSSASIDLQDVFTSTTTKITTGPDNTEDAVIDGQTYHFANLTSGSASQFTVTWGDGSSARVPGNYWSVYPTLKTKSGALVGFTNTTGVTVVGNETTVQLPSGAVTIKFTHPLLTETPSWSVVSGVAKEDGTTSVASVTSGGTNSSSMVFSLGRTATGAVLYNATKVTGQAAFTMRPVGSTGSNATTQPAVILVEEKDDAGAQAAAVFPSALGTSGGNSLAGIGAPDFTGTNSASQSWGSNSNKASTVDLWGTLTVRDTSASAQPIVDVYYPDIQRIASVFVLGSGASVVSGNTTAGGVYKQAVPIKTSIAKLDTEVTSADETNKNLILVGGPAVNQLVAQLAAANKTRAVTFYRSQGAGYALIDHVADAFASGKVALVVAGYEGSDTRTVADKLQNFDTAGLTGTRAEFRNGVITTVQA